MKATISILVLSAVAIAGPAIAQNGEACGKLASVQNDVETRAESSERWAPSTRNQQLFASDRVRTGTASRAAILYSDQTLHRINENSEVEVLPPAEGGPGVLKVITGQHYFSTRRPKDYGRVETPTVTAAIRGTEFVVDVAPSGVTTITMIEGVVDATNEFGSLRVGAGEAAYVEPGKAPVKRIAVRPRDAVSWSLYYPRVLGGADAEKLRSMGADGESLSNAATLLYGGQVAQATPLIEDVRRRDPQNVVAMALAAVIEVTADRKDEARQLARGAYDTDPDSVAAALAMSFVYQADFDIAAAREMAERAVALDPESAEALARVAELRMAEGDVDGARDAAERAVRRDPDSARAHAVLGFVQLAELRTATALATFEKAVDLDPALPLARLGHGIALFRSDLVAGREEMQTAVLLDPENALLRSYLGKSYYEEGRPYEAEKEFEAAKRMDPSDPTPHLYDSILKRTYNRPVEALEDLQRSIELNDKRAVYRSRLLLDEDLAVRSTDLAGVYNDLGFNQLGMVTARSSADADQSNFSSHLFLAGTYRNLPGFAPAFLSETLQARIYQPVNTNAVRPDVINESVSFNEYTALFERPRMRAFAGLRYGATSNNLDEYFSPGQQCFDPATNSLVDCIDLVSVNDSRVNGGDVTLTLNRERFAGAIAYRTDTDDGFRINNDQDTDALRAFFVYAPTRKDQLQLNVIDGSRTTGDLPLRGYPGLINQERLTTDLTNVGVGYRRVLSPSSDLAVSLIYNETQQVSNNPVFMISGDGLIEGGQMEAQYVRRQRHVRWTAGAGRYDGTQEVTSTTVGFGSTTLKADDQFTNAYVYAKLPDLGRFDLTAGLSYEDVNAPVGLLVPRDSLLGIADLAFEESAVSPKLGASMQAGPKTVLRAAAYRRLTPAIGRLQTLEPTQVSGFNQFFRDRAGTESTNYGFGVDQEITKKVFGGLSVLRRDLDIPEATCSAPLGGTCAFQTADVIADRTSDDWLGNLYVNATAGKRVALSLEYAYEERDFDFTQVSNNSLYENYVETTRLRPQVRFFLPNGLFASVRGSNFDQQVDQFDPFSPATVLPVQSEFWIVDAEVGFRLPRRLGTVSLQVFNLGNKAFDFYLSSLEEDVIPARTALLSVSFTSR